MPHIQVAYKVKFRALFTDLATVADSFTLPLPPILTVVSALLEPHEIGRYNNHGVQIIVTLVNK
jgi:hypothetical protein